MNLIDYDDEMELKKLMEEHEVWCKAVKDCNDAGVLASPLKLIEKHYLRKVTLKIQELISMMAAGGSVFTSGGYRLDKLCEDIGNETRQALGKGKIYDTECLMCGREDVTSRPNENNTEVVADAPCPDCGWERIQLPGLLTPFLPSEPLQNQIQSQGQLRIPKYEDVDERPSDYEDLEPPKLLLPSSPLAPVQNQSQSQGQLYIAKYDEVVNEPLPEYSGLELPNPLLPPLPEPLQNQSQSQVQLYIPNNEVLVEKCRRCDKNCGNHSRLSAPSCEMCKDKVFYKGCYIAVSFLETLKRSTVYEYLSRPNCMRSIPVLEHNKYMITFSTKRICVPQPVSRLPKNIKDQHKTTKTPSAAAD
ncbi:hypothetical protein G7Y89_g4997 [Cudoniella acicularis]|uniref:Uncharacterized protein n=1 Tax=Cudoniella acicularis TaxID=354080 RepID=A0A8H4RQE1_9HELO|nr:hypothetical protein G7Y89_g4997 [Cudoniella acicularis]